MTVGVDQDRVRATWILCETLIDHLPQARQSSSVLGNSAGLAGGRLVPCVRCGARGRVTAKGNPCASCTPRMSPSRSSVLPVEKHGCRPCLACDGAGWRKRRAGEQEWDEYAGVEMAPEPTGLVNEVKQALALEKERPEILDLALRRADRTLAEMTGVTHEEGWEAAWRRKSGAGSYRELAMALERLRDVEPMRYSIVWRVVVMAEERTLAEPVAAFLNESMVMLAGMMPERIKVPRWIDPAKAHAARKHSLWFGKTAAHARQRAERDAEVNRLRFEEQWKVSRIARFVALSEMQVKRINAKYREQQQAVASAPPAA
jgi:hypothetical protein